MREIKVSAIYPVAKTWVEALRQPFQTCLLEHDSSPGRLNVEVHIVTISSVSTSSGRLVLCACCFVKSIQSIYPRANLCTEGLDSKALFAHLLLDFVVALSLLPL